MEKHACNGNKRVVHLIASENRRDPGVALYFVVLQSRLMAEGQMSKYKKVKFDVKRVVRLYKSGKNVSQIAQLVGYPAGHGNNRTRSVLVKAGVYKKAS